MNDSTIKSPQKKVLVTATTFPRWNNDKVPYFIYDLCQQYRRNNLEVIVLSPHYHNAKFVENLQGIKVYRFPYFFPWSLQRVCYDGGILDNLRKSLLAKLQIPIFMLSDLIYMFWLVKKEQVQVIHSHWIISQGLIAAILSKIIKINHINTMHAGDIALLEKLPFKKIISIFIFSNTNKITVVSTHGKNRFINILPKKFQLKAEKKIEILPMGIDLKSFATNLSKLELKKRYNIKEKNILLFIGRLSQKKGVEYLIKAMPTIIKNNPHTILFILGDGREKNALIKLVNELHISHNIEFKGFVTGQEKNDFLKLADILIIPSIETTNGDVEGLPVVVLEGLASKVGIVATSTGGIPDVIHNGINGLLVPQANEKEIAKAVIKMLSDEKISGKNKNVYSVINKFDWNVIGEKYTNLINNI